MLRGGGGGGDAKYGFAFRAYTAIGDVHRVSPREDGMELRGHGSDFLHGRKGDVTTYAKKHRSTLIGETGNACFTPDQVTRNRGNAPTLLATTLTSYGKPDFPSDSWDYQKTKRWIWLWLWGGFRTTTTESRDVLLRT